MPPEHIVALLLQERCIFFVLRSTEAGHVGAVRMYFFDETKWGRKCTQCLIKH